MYLLLFERERESLITAIYRKTRELKYLKSDEETCFLCCIIILFMFIVLLNIFFITNIS